MVATLTKPAKPDYYIRSQAHLNAPSMTFPARGEPVGTWWNPAGLFSDIDDPPLHGHRIDPLHFYRLYNGFHPQTETPLTRNSGKPARIPGHDLTFAADKTISAIWAITPASLRTAIASLHDRAVHAALDEIVAQHCNFTRSRKDAKTIVTRRAHAIAALFRHGNSRAGDPHLHTRVLLFNVALAQHDRKWRSLHARPLYFWRHAAGAVYRAELAWLLRHDLGIATEQHGDNGQFTRIPGVPQPLLTQWSSRATQIKAINSRMSPHRLDPAARDTVRRKSGVSTNRVLRPPQRHVLWTLEAMEHIRNLDTFLADLASHPRHVPTPQLIQTRDAIRELPSLLCSSATQPTHPQVFAATFNACAGRLSSNERQTALHSVLSHAPLRWNLASPPYTDGIDIPSPATGNS